MNETQRFTTRIRALVAKHDLKEALRQLRLLLENSPALEEALQQEERFRDIRRQIRLGLVDEEQASLLHNRISAGILELLRELESPEGIQPAVRAEVERAAGVVNSKNVVVDSTIEADQNVVIGDGETPFNKRLLRMRASAKSPACSAPHPSFRRYLSAETKSSERSTTGFSADKICCCW